MEEIRNIILRLKNNPLFYMSQASKELFHSNFWEWLAEKNTIETLKIFSDKDYEENNLSFKREYNQTCKKTSPEKEKIKSKNDMVFIQGKGGKRKVVLVIENKVKDFPYEKQLKRIRASFNNDEAIEYVLVTLYLNEGQHFDGWNKILRYNQIADRIKPEQFTENEFESSLIKSYTEFCKTLHELASALPITTDYDFTFSLNRPLMIKLNEVKLAEGYSKMRANHFLNMYRKCFDFLECDYSINHQKATISIAYPLRDEYAIGVQLEGNQKRKFVKGENHKLFAENLSQQSLFFNPNWQSPRERRPFLEYKPDFYYQYDPITKVMSYNTLFTEINEIMECVNTNKVKIERCIP